MKEVVREGLACGYRAFDTACSYGNEAIVGRVLSEALSEFSIEREEIFLTTKIAYWQQIEGNFMQQLDFSLNNLRVSYIDLWLIHWPLPDYYIQTWQEIEKIYCLSDKVRAIGISNTRERHLAALFDAGITIKPMVCQMEYHPLRTVPGLMKLYQKHNIAVQSYSPLCRMAKLLTDSPVLNALSVKYHKTIAQIILRWHIEKGAVPVFRSVTPSRLQENIDIFDFQLDNTEIALIDALDRDYKCHLESVCCPGF